VNAGQWVFRQGLFLLALLALAFNSLLLVSVTLDLEWARTRAAGGQFEEFPLVIRAVYLMMSVAMIFLMRLSWRFLHDEASQKEHLVAKWIGRLFVASAFTQLISQSADERWNAIPALVIATAFLVSARRNQKQ